MTLGTFGTPGANTLAGSNIYANDGTGGAPAGAYFDDICFEELSENAFRQIIRKRSSDD